MKILSLVLAVAISSIAVSAMAANPADIVFQCNTKNNKVIQIVDNNNGTATYTFGGTGKPEKTITEAYDKTDATTGKAGRVLDFTAGDYTYSVSIGLGAYDKVTDGNVMVQKGTKTLATIKCTGGYIAKGDHFWSAVNN